MAGFAGKVDGNSRQFVFQVGNTCLPKYPDPSKLASWRTIIPSCWCQLQKSHKLGLRTRPRVLASSNILSDPAIAETKKFSQMTAIDNNLPVCVQTIYN